MSDQPETLDLTSHDAVDPRRQDVLRLFPDVRTEGGKINFDRLRLALGDMVDTGRERYGMTWPGKADCYRAIQTPSLGTLRPCPEESVNFDTTENLIIEGDNLEVLLFHPGVPLEYVRGVFGVMARAHWHRFQVLTKRAECLEELSAQLHWAPNIWLGVSVETERYKSRIDHLRGTDARVKFLSLEPLLGPLPGLDLRGIDWVIVGGESGPGARPMDPAWATDLRDQCRQANVPFFFKQWGGKNKKQAGRVLEGRVWDEMPVTGATGIGAS